MIVIIIIKTHYYITSSNDIVILEKVGHPFAVNPAPKLRQHALQSAWQIHDFKFIAGIHRRKEFIYRSQISIL